MSRRGPTRRAALAPAVALVGTAAAGAAARHFGRVLLRPTSADEHRDRVIGHEGADVVVLAPRRTARLPGAYGFVWEGGCTTLGPALDDAPEGVRRRVLRGARPPVGAQLAITSELWRGDPLEALGLAFDGTPVEGPLGPLPTWWIGEGDTAAIIVHGRAVERYEGLRLARVLHDVGVGAVLPAYRNDPGAPASPDGIYHLGDTEWEDVLAVLRAARARGVERVLLAGFSTGGAIVQALLERAPAEDTAAVVAVILDAPVLDWRAVIHLQARLRRVPRPVASLAARSAGRRAGIDWDALDVRADRLALPTLLLLADADRTVPVRPALDLAAARPDLVRLERFPGADHVRAWNSDPERYAAVVRAFLADVLG